MNKEQEAKAKAQFEKMSKGAKEEDIKRINENIQGMNKGAIKEIWDKVLQLWAMIKDPEAAWASKATAIGALIYLISPIDAIPDVIPVIGLADDAAIIMAAVAALGAALKKYTPEDVK